MKKCPCCSQTLLRHVRQGGQYWFCTHCRQEMPDLLSIRALTVQKASPYHLSPMWMLANSH